MSFTRRLNAIQDKATGRFFARQGEQTWAPTGETLDDASFFLPTEIRRAAISFYGDTAGVEDRYIIVIISAAKWHQILGRKGGRKGGLARKPWQRPQLNRGMVTENNATKMIGHYLDALALRGCSKTTVDDLTFEFALFERFLAGRPFNRANFEAWIISMREKGNACATLRKKRKWIDGFVKWLRDNDYAKPEFDPVRKSSLALCGPLVFVRPKVVITAEQHRAIVARAAGKPPWLTYAVTMGWETGFRVSDVALLERSDISWADSCVRRILYKTRRQGRVAEIPLSPELVTYLQAVIEASGEHSKYVCAAMADLYFNERAKLCIQLSEVLGPGASFHAYRRSFITRLLERGVSAETVSSITGQSLQIVMGYAVIRLDAKREAMAKLQGVA